MRNAFLALFCLVPLSLSAQIAPSSDQLHQWLTVSQRRSLLLGESAPPVHIAATIQDLTNPKKPNAYTFDELYRDQSAFKIVTNIVEHPILAIENTEAKPPSEPLDAVAWLEQFLLQPFASEALTTHRLTLLKNFRDIKNLDCIGVEPELPNVPLSLPLAQTAYCLTPGNHLLRLVAVPGSVTVKFDDFAPFGTKTIARTLTAYDGDLVIARLHIDTLETPTSFAALDATPSPLPTIRERTTMLGQLLYAPIPNVQFPNSNLPAVGDVTLSIHIDKTGAVTHITTVTSRNTILLNAAIAAVKNFHYSVAYQGDRIVESDQPYFFHYGTPY